MKRINTRVLVYGLRCVLICVLALVVVCIEIVLASLGYLAAMGRLRLFRYPYLQWFDGLRWWDYSSDVRFSVCLGLAVPAVITLMLGVIAVRLWWSKRKPPQELYGRTEWMTPREATEQGGKLKRRPL